jgi:peroxiredoxin
LPFSFQKAIVTNPGLVRQSSKEGEPVWFAGGEEEFYMKLVSGGVKKIVLQQQKRFTGLMFLAMMMCVVLSPVMANEFEANLLKGFDDSIHTLGEYTGQGKWTVVMMWASDCQVCNAEAKQYVKFHEAHKNKDARILGVSLDGQSKKAEARKFIERHGVTFPNLIDEPEKVANLYSGLTGQPWIGTPTFLVYSPTGELLATQVGAVSTEIIESFIEKESAQKKSNENAKESTR